MWSVRKGMFSVSVLSVLALALCLGKWSSGAQPPPNPPPKPVPEKPAPKPFPDPAPVGSQSPEPKPVGGGVPISGRPKFDSSVIYDEFDSLMNKEFLIHPDRYVRTVKERLSRADYNAKQKGRFLLRPHRQGWGIAVVHTNKNTWGKLLFTWGAPVQNGEPSLVVKEVTLFGRVMDGASPRKYENLVIKSSYQADLDTGNTSNPGTAADIWFHNVGGGEMYIEAVNGATLEFPLESMCR